MANYSKHGIYALVWVKVRYLRERAAAGGRLPYCRKDVPARELWFGAPSLDQQLFRLIDHSAGDQHPDPEGKGLQSFVIALEQNDAEDNDLAFIRYCCMFNDLFKKPTPKIFGGRGANLSPFEAAMTEDIVKYVLPRLAKCSRCKVFLSPLTSQAGASVVESGWNMFRIFLAAYCQRLIYPKGNGFEDHAERIRQATDPGRFADVNKLFTKGSGNLVLDIANGELWFNNDADRSKVLGFLKGSFQLMPPPTIDATGFHCFCERSQLAWLYVRLVRQWVNDDGPIPRRQELPCGFFIIGTPPPGCRKFVVSHGWETELHPCPGSGKMRRLACVLNSLGASDDDVLFFDFCSTSQASEMGYEYKRDQGWSGAPARDGTCGPYFEKYEDRVASLFPIVPMSSGRSSIMPYGK